MSSPGRFATPADFLSACDLSLVQQGCWEACLWYRPGLCHCRFRIWLHASKKPNHQIVSS
jgi:hypothetical protein